MLHLRVGSKAIAGFNLKEGARDMKRIVVGCLMAVAALAAEAQVVTFVYTGAPQSFVVPPGVTSVHIAARGAEGWTGTNPGGLGGSAEGDLAVTPGETLDIFVGGQGTEATVNLVPAGGGFNGGGNGQTNGANCCVGGGGGASDVRQGGAALANRVLVAAGGGGSTDNVGTFGGNGGGLVGLDGGQCCGGSLATGGSQVAGGTIGGLLGQGGSGTGVMTPWNGGGGGGYYGGGVSDAHSGGGGGSSYIGGVTAGSMTAGVGAGNGQVVISFAGGAAIPTLSQWMTILLATILLASGAIVLHRRGI